MSSVITPLIMLLAVGATFLFVQARHAGSAPIRIGTIYVMVVVLYGSYPLIVYILLGGLYTPFNDGRLFVEQPGPADVSRVAWHYVVYLITFCTGYSFFGRGARKARSLSVDLDFSVLWALIVVFIAFRSLSLLAELLFANQARDYLETYLKYRHLPLLAQQLLGHMEGMTSILGIALVAALCRRWNSYRWIVFGWLALELLLMLANLGARTQFVLLCLATIFSYHYLWRPISTTALVSTGSMLVIVFLAVGVLRQYGSTEVAAIGIELIASSTEFEALFANAFDVQRLITIGEIDRGSIVGTVLVGDFVNLVPQQLVPFAKISLPLWYLETFYPELLDRGGGLAFGAVAEALVGLGWPDLIWRAVLVSGLLAFFDRWLTQERLTFRSFVLCLWLMCSCYIVFRTTTFALVPVFFYRFMPAILIVGAFAYLLRAAATRPVERPA